MSALEVTFPDEGLTMPMRAAGGAAVRSSAFRFVPALLDDPTIAPYAAEMRFAVPLPTGRIGVLHFETLSLTRYEQLETLFDVIAGTARVA